MFDSINPFPTEIVPNESIVFLYLMLIVLLYGAMGLLGWRGAAGLVGVWYRGRKLAGATKQLGQATGGQSQLTPFGRRHNLAELWKDFGKIHEAHAVTVDGTPFGVSDPEAVFSEEAILRGYNKRLSLALSAIFAGLGILGTFWGLYLGLQDIVISDEEQLFESVQTLLSGMSAAFTTSLVGILLSLVWRIAYRFTHHQLRRNAHAFFGTVRTHFNVKTPEEVLAESLRVAADQKGILQTLGTDVASAMQEVMERSFSPALNSISETLKTVTTRVDERQMEALDDLVVAFREQLLGAMDDQMERLAAAVQGATEWQQRVNEDVGNVFERIVAVSETTTRLVERGGEAADRYLASLDGLRESHALIAETATQMRETAAQASATSSQLGEGVDAFAEANMELRTALATQLDETKSQIDRLVGFWEGHGGKLDDLAVALEGSLTEFSHLTREKLQQIFAQFDKEMATVVDHLAGTLAELREATEDIVPGVTRIEEAISESLAPVRASEQKLSALTDAILGFDAMPERLDLIVARADDVAAALRKLQDHLDQSSVRRRFGRLGGRDAQE